MTLRHTQTDRQMARHTHGQADKHTQRQTETDRQTARVVDFFAERVINVWNCLLITLHLQLLGVVLTVLILHRP